MGRLKGFDRNEVLDQALQVFWKKGFADTSLSDLEKATGVNKSGLYSEFKDKEDIFCESLKRYSDTTPVINILTAEPLGWKNIETFLKAGMTCKGQKGCYMANSLREYSIIPTKAKQLIAESSKEVNDVLIANIKATGTKRDPALLANMIQTFASGLSLKLNAVKPDQLSKEADDFLEMCRKL